MAKSAGLTVKEIAALKPRDVAYEIKDGAVTGAYVVVFPSGATSYILRYRFHGAKKKLTIGRFDPSARGGLADARKKAFAALASLAQARAADSDTLLVPAAAKVLAKRTRAKEAQQALREATAGTDDIEKVVDLFIERHCVKLRTGDEMKRVLKREVVSRWKGRGLGTITKADVHQLLDSIVDRGAPIMANRVFSHLRKLCRFAMSRGVIEHNPLRRNHASVKGKRRRSCS